jgi:hypothetical protein
MAKGLRVASDLELPLEAAETTWAILGKKGSGKSTTAVDLVEEVLKHAQIPVAVLDPTGVWWGIRSSADGKSAGFPLTIFGGDHKDAPLEATAGELMADVVAEDRASCVFDLSYFNVRELQRFAYDFLSRLYLKNRHAMFLVLDEADDFAPQVIRGGEKGGYAERMLGAAERLVKQGRVRGIAPCFITQRPASLNKNVLSQIDSLVVMRLLSPHDRDAIKEWVKYNGTAEQLAELQADLATLDTGTGYIWSPETLDLFRKVAFRPSETFDSRRKPRAGKQIAPPKVLAAVDLKKLEHKMSALIDRAKADDPKELRAEIAKLKKQLDKPLCQPVADKPTIDRAVMAALVEQHSQFIARGNAALEAIYKVRPALEAVDAAIAAMTDYTKTPVMTVHTNGQPLKPATAGALVDVARAATRQFGHAPAASKASFPKGEKAVLAAIAQYPNGVYRNQLTVLTGYKKTSRDAYIARLRDRAYIDVVTDGRILALNAGVEALGNDYSPPLTGQARREKYLKELPAGESKVLQAAIEVFPEAVLRETVSAVTGYKKTSRDAYIARLRARELIEAGRDGIRASEDLF